MNCIWKAFIYSLHGLKDVFKAERAFRQEVILFCFLIPIAIFIPVSGITKLLLVLFHFLVLIIELLNSSIEAMIDLVSPSYNNLAKNAKNYGSAAVFLSLLSLFTFWIYILIKLFL